MGSSNVEKFLITGVEHINLSASSSKGHVSGQGVDGPKLMKKLKALIVDDNPVNRRIMRMLLTSLGVESQEVENGKMAVDLYHAGAVFDIILIDNEMPVMDGPKATRMLRSMGVRTKIVGVSGNSSSKEVEEFMDAGLDDFQEKPMTRAKLITILEELQNNF